MNLFNKKTSANVLQSVKSISQKISDKYILKKEKSLFLKALSKPNFYSYSFFYEKWNMYEDSFKKDLISIYQKNKFSTYAELISKESNNSLLDLMLSSGFCLNKKDIKNLKKESWLKYKHFYSKSIDKQIKSKIYKYPFIVFNKIKKVTIKPKPYLSMINTFNISTNDVLTKHFHKLPIELQKQVIKSATSEQLLVIYEQDVVC